MIDLNNTVFLIDGMTELGSLKDKFQCDYNITPSFRLIKCNGKSVTEQGYVSASFGTLISVLCDRFRHIICILDRENRSISSINLAIKIREKIITNLLEHTKYKSDDLEKKLVVCVTDRVFENWIIADIDGIKRKKDLIKVTAVQKDYDGKNGETELKRIMKKKYKKTIHARVLFKSIVCKRAVKNSESFSNFINCIKA